MRESRWLSLAELTLQSTGRMSCRAGYQRSQCAAWCDVPPRWRPLRYTGKSTIGFNLFFLALLARSAHSPLWDTGSFQLPLPRLGIRRVALRRAAAVPAGHSVALKSFFCFSAALLPSDFLLALAGLLPVVLTLRFCARPRPQRPPVSWLSWGSIFCVPLEADTVLVISSTVALEQ